MDGGWGNDRSVFVRWYGTGATPVDSI